MAMVAGSLFYPANFPALAPFLQPVVRSGRMLTIGNLQGLEYVRSSAPEYLRKVDVGSLHTFAGGPSAVLAWLFAGSLSILAFWVGQGVGRGLLATVGKFVKGKGSP